MGIDNPADNLNLEASGASPASPWMAGAGSGPVTPPGGNGGGNPPAPPVAPNVDNGSFSERMKAAADKLGIAPGIDGWAKSLVASGMEALGKGPSAQEAQATDATRKAALDKATGGDVTPATQRPPQEQPLAVRAVSGIKGILGDAAAGASAGGGARGALTGIAGTAAAASKRDQEQNNNRLLTAKANAEMLHQQRLMHEMDQQMMDAGALSGGKALAAIENPASGTGGGQTLYRDQSSDQLHDLLAQGKIDPTKQTVFHTGNVIDGKDANGIPRYRATYSVVELGGPVKLGEQGKDDGPHQDVLNFINAHREDNQKIPAGTVLDSAQLNSMYQTASNAQTFQDAMSLAREKAGVEKGELDQKADHLAISKDPDVQNALATAMRDGGDKAYAPIRAYDALTQNAAFMKKHPSFNGPAFFGDEKGWNELNHDFRTAAGKSSDLIGELAKDPLKIEGHSSSAIAAAQDILSDPNASAARKADAQRVVTIANNTRQLEVDLEGAKDLKKAEIKKGAEGRSNPNGLTGEAFIQTLPAGRQNSLRAIYNGTLAVNPSALERTDKGQAFMDDIYAAYPDFEAHKGIEWPKVYNEFTNPGAKTGNAILRGNTAIDHGRELYDSTTLDGVFNPLSKAYQDRQVIVGRFSDEVGAAIKGGVVGLEEGERMLDSIKGTSLGSLTIGDRKERIKKSVDLLMERLNETQDKFDAGKPSQYIKTKPVVSDRARANYDYIQNDGKAPDQQPQPAAKPTGNTPPPNTTLMEKGGVRRYIPNTEVDAWKAKGASTVSQ